MHLFTALSLLAFSATVYGRYHMAFDTSAFTTARKKRAVLSGYCERDCGALYDCMEQQQGNCEQECQDRFGEDLREVRNNCDTLFDDEGVWDVQDTDWVRCANSKGFDFCRKPASQSFNFIGLFGRRNPFHTHDNTRPLPRPPPNYLEELEGEELQSYEECMDTCITKGTKHCFQGCPSPSALMEQKLKESCDRDESTRVDSAYEKCLTGYNRGYEDPNKEWIQPFLSSYNNRFMRFLYNIRELIRNSFCSSTGQC